MIRSCIVPLLLPLLLAGCVQELSLPDLGPCAEYPEGLYDYGDLGVGTCLAGPVDLKVVEEGDGDWRLYVANSNPNLLFTSGSLLGLSGDALEQAAAEGGSLLISDYATAAHSYPTRSYSGPLSYDPDRGAMYYGNRLSFTTAATADDRLEGVFINGDGTLSPFTDFAAETGDGTFAEAGHDPFAITRHPETGQLYTVNIRSHDVTIFDTDEARNSTVRYARAYLDAELPDPVFTDVGLPSLVETLILNAEAETLPTDGWELTYIEPVRRFFYPIEAQGLPALTFTDAPGLTQWQPTGAGAVLSAGTTDDDDAWDRGGVLHAAVLDNDSQLVTWYTGTDGATTAIGVATTPGLWPGAWEKHDAGVQGVASDDAVLTAGPDDFDAGGVANAAVYRADASTFRLWYNALGADGLTRIAVARAENSVEWEKQGVALEAQTAGESVADPRVTVRAGFGFEMYYVEGDLDAGTCVRFADSDDGLSFTPGGEDGFAAGCLLSEVDGLPPILRSPQLSVDPFQTHMWVSGADSPDGPWSVYHARSFDRVSWEVTGAVTVLPAPDGVLDATALLKAFTYQTGGETIGSFRIERENTGIQQQGAGFGGSTTNLGLTFALFGGHVLPAPAYDQAWWGAPSEREITASVRFEGPAALAGWPRLFMSSYVQGDDISRVGYAQAIESEGVPEGAMFEIPADGSGGAANLAGASAAGQLHPWLIQPEASSDEAWMYYAEVTTAGDWRIRRAISDDLGQTWGQASTVLSGPTGLVVDDPSVVLGHNGSFHMWYTSELGAGVEILHATSPAGATFTRSETGGLSPGEPGSWDDAGVSQPSVVWDAARGVYHLWYTGDNGTRTRIGYAQGVPGAEGIVWTRYRDPSSGVRVGVVDGIGLGWDNDGVSHPMVLQLSADSYRLYYMGTADDGSTRLGLMTSFDGTTWQPVSAPPTAGDRIAMRTAPSSAEESDEPKEDATLALQLGPNLGDLDGTSSTAIALVPTPYGDEVINCFAVVTTRYKPTVYLIDVYDDSAAANGGVPGPCVEITNPELFASAGPDFVDANYNAHEEVFLIGHNIGGGGARSIAFSPDMSRMYLTSGFPDSLLIVDTAHFVDDPTLQVGEVTLPILGFVEVERGLESANSDADNQTGIVDYSADIGPTGVVISPVEGGRYVFVANGDEHSVYTIDLRLGAYGQVVKIAHDVGDVPYAMELSPDGRYLFVGNYVGEVDDKVVNSTLAIIAADPSDPDFGQVIATLKNREI